MNQGASGASKSCPQLPGGGFSFAERRGRTSMEPSVGLLLLVSIVSQTFCGFGVSSASPSVLTQLGSVFST